jgi:dihydropteroate synthase
MFSTAWSIRGRQFVWGARTYVMGILNITPDSFSGDGLQSKQDDTSWVELSLRQARRFVAAGADILDIGGESTRPGAQPVSAEEELQRVLPVIQAVRAELDGVISIDTYKAMVAEVVLQAGADIVNDVWGLRADPDLGAVAARWHAPIILMHNRSAWAPVDIRKRLGEQFIGAPYTNLVEEVCAELLESAALAQAAGIPADQIMLDAGIGFGKTVAQNLELIDRLGELRALGYPVLLGPSRKSFIGHTLNLPPDQRLEGTAAAVAVGIARGADIVRVHDVETMVRVARLSDAIVRRPS